MTQLRGNNESLSALLQYWNKMVFALLTMAVLPFSTLYSIYVFALSLSWGTLPPSQCLPFNSLQLANKRATYTELFIVARFLYRQDGGEQGTADSVLIRPFPRSRFPKLRLTLSNKSPDRSCSYKTLTKQQLFNPAFLLFSSKSILMLGWSHKVAVPL